MASLKTREGLTTKPILVEEDKPAKERGYYYTYPELFMVSQKREGGISRLLVPEIEKELLLINDENKLPRRKKYLFDSKSTTRKKEDKTCKL